MVAGIEGVKLDSEEIVKLLMVDDGKVVGSCSVPVELEL